jgi:hypothetical protein
MPYALVVVLMLLLAACGGGDSNAPTPTPTHSVTVSGEGAGAGHIRATQGTNLDCTVGNGGTCNLTLDEGTVLGLTAEADASSIFTTWSSDAASCGTATSCTITVDRTLNLAAHFDPGFPVAAGVYAVTGFMDGLTPDQGSITGTLTLTQASRASGTLGGSAALLARVGTDVFNIVDNDLNPANVSMAGVVAFTMSNNAGSNWTFTGTLSGTSIVNGRHTLSSSTGSASGSWSATRTSGIIASVAGRSVDLPALLERLKRR